MKENNLDLNNVGFTGNPGVNSSEKTAAILNKKGNPDMRYRQNKINFNSKPQIPRKISEKQSLGYEGYSLNLNSNKRNNEKDRKEYPNKDDFEKYDAHQVKYGGGFFNHRNSVADHKYRSQTPKKGKIKIPTLESLHPENEIINNIVGDIPYNKTTGDTFSETETDDEDLDEILMEVNLKKPRRAYNYFILEKMEKDNSRNLIEMVKQYKNKWRELPIDEKSKYHEMAIEDEKRFKEHTKKARDYIVGSEHEFIQVTPDKLLFLDGCIRKAINVEGADLNIIRDMARQSWKTLNSEERIKYDENSVEYENLNNNVLGKDMSKITPLNIFIRDQKYLALEEDNEKESRNQIFENWKNSNKDIKDKYHQYVEILKEERNRTQNNNNIENIAGLRPKRPLGPYRNFLIEMSSLHKFEGKNAFIEGSALWKKISLEQKEKYVKIAKKEKIEYSFRKAEFLHQTRYLYGRARSAFNLFAHDLKKELINKTFSQGEVLNHIHSEWKNASKDTVERYKKLAEIDKYNAEEKREVLKESLTGDIKKRIPTPYAIYVRDSIKDLQNTSGKDMQNIFRSLGDIWRNMDVNQKNIFYDKYNDELKKDCIN